MLSQLILQLSAQKLLGNSALYASLTFAVLVCALSFLAYQHRCSKSKKAILPFKKHKSSYINIYVQVAVLLVKIVCDGFLLFYSLETSNALSQIIRLLTSLGLLVVLATFPPVEDYKASHHITCLIVVYFAVFLETLYQVFAFPASKIDQYSAIYRLSVSSFLFILACILPYPLDPDNIITLGCDTIELKENQIYRNGCPLIPEASASALSWISLEWVGKFIMEGYKRTPTASNIYAMTYTRLARAIYEEFNVISRLELYRKLWVRLFMASWKLFCTSFVAYFLQLSLGYISIYYQQKLIHYVEVPDGRPITVAYRFAFSIFLVNLLSCCILTAKEYASQNLEFRIDTMLNISIFNKTLRRKDMSGKFESDDDSNENEKKTDEKKQSTSNNGKINNLMNNDASTVASTAIVFDQYILIPFNFCTAAFYLYNVLGISALMGSLSMIALLPLYWIFARVMLDTITKWYAASDNRGELVNELLHGVRLLKYFAWETSWKDKALEARKLEIKLRLKSAIWYAAMDAISTAAPLMVAIVSFVWYTKVMGNELTATVVFTSISLFNKLQGPIMQTTNIISSFTYFKVSLDRISNFFDEPEINQEMYSALATVPEGKQPEDVLVRVGFEDSIFQWHCEPIPPVLSSATSADSGLIDRNFQLCVPAFDFPVGCLTIVCGPTGSGKSSFLSALLGEMDAVSGRVHLPSKCQIAPPVSRIDSSYPDLLLDKVAYVCQRPFLQHDTIRNNILFGEPFDPARYKKVISQCCLVADLSLWPDRDLTEIGQKGITLSGGQKQRVSLARAVYSHAKTVLIDDCLSAVDSHTARHIYEKCINGELLKGRTVILTTHHIHLCLPTAKFLVKIEDGHVVWHGSVEEARKRDKLQNLVDDTDWTEQEHSREIVEEDFELATDKDSAQKLIAEEESVKGSVDFKVWAFYLKACGGWFFWIVVATSAVMAQTVSFLEYWWLRKWMLAYDAEHTNFTLATLSQTYSGEPSRVKIDINYYIIGYVLICLAQLFFDLLDTFVLTSGILKGSMKMFEDLLRRVINAPMRFFDTTPVGRILNRFSGDMYVIDYSLGRSVGYILHMAFGVIFTVIIMSFITPEFIIVGLVAAAVNIVLGILYTSVSRDLRRITSVEKSPIYSIFSETLEGITTIRAYMQQDRFMSKIYKLQDTYMAPTYLLYATRRWFSFRLDFSGALLTLAASIFILWRINDFDAGLVGISLYYSGNLSSYISNLIDYYANLQVDMTAVERVQEYTQIEQEPPSIIEGRRPPAAWPTTAAIQVRDLEIRYTPKSEPVLHSISFDVRPHEKIGIVGRTGSGKSTLAQSFFRFVEATRGSIKIDGINIFDIGLQDLRSRITIIPQDAELFSGTIRTNLDPFVDHTDSELWESLQQVHLAQPHEETSHPITDEAVDVSPHQYSITSLDQPVSEGGNNFSQGERQLICMARALLRNSRLIIMDEATANVDFDADTRVQKTIRQGFVDATLICIAHRLRTVIDYDRILVLSQGNIVEYDTPHNLLSQPTSVFRSMCEKSGELDILVNMAKQSSLQKPKIFKLADDHGTYH